MLTLVAALGIIKLSSHLNEFQATKPTTIQLQQKIYPLIKPMELIGDGAVLDGHGATLTGNGSVGIHVGALGHVTVKNVILSGFATGIFAQGASDLTLSNVTITNVQTGVRLEKVTEGLVQTVSVHAAKIGVQLSGCTKLIIDKVDLSQNSQIGMDVSTSSNCILRDNKINRIGEGTTNGVGLSITNASDHNQILRNTVVHCTGYGINFNSVGNTPSTDNTFDGNDISWTTAGTGFNATQEAGNFYLDNTAGFCRLGLVFTNVTNSQMKGNLCVGNTEVGIKDVDGSRNTYENNVFVMENGSQLAFQITSSPNISSDIRLFQNIFQDYQKPIRVENASPLTLQSNVFGGVKSTDLADIASVVGRKPLALSSEESKPKPSDFVLSNGPIAMVPSIYDRVGGISISSSNPGIFEVVVEGSLTGLFQGEEQVFASYKGEMPVDMIFPPRFAAQVRTRVIAEKPTYFPFSALLGDNSMAKDHPADDSGDTLFKPAIAVDGDTTSIDHAWQPPKGKAGEWWEVDLKSDQIINAVSILAPPSHPNDFWGKFHISVSSNGLFKGEEKVVATEENFSQTQGPQRIYRFPATVGRYVRIYGDQDQIGVQLQQVGVYGIKH